MILSSISSTRALLKLIKGAGKSGQKIFCCCMQLTEDTISQLAACVPLCADQDQADLTSQIAQLSNASPTRRFLSAPGTHQTCGLKANTHGLIFTQHLQSHFFRPFEVLCRCVSLWALIHVLLCKGWTLLKVNWSAQNEVKTLCQA